jgi:hypothetical protein
MGRCAAGAGAGELLASVNLTDKSDVPGNALSYGE